MFPIGIVPPVLLIHRHALDESLPVHVVLESPHLEDDDVEERIRRLAINLELRAYGKAPAPNALSEGRDERSPSRNEDIIWSGKVETGDSPFIFGGKHTASGEEPVYTIWQKSVSLGKELHSTMITM